MDNAKKTIHTTKQLNYFREHKYEESPILKSMDPYRQELPIGYATNCTRRIDIRESTKDQRGDLGFGIIHARYTEMNHVLDGIDQYNALMLTDLMANVYNEEGSTANHSQIYSDVMAYLETRPVEAIELLRRFFPSNYNWMISKDGSGFNNGKIFDPIQHFDALNNLRTDPRKRQSMFNNAEHHHYYKLYKKDADDCGQEPAF